MKKRIAVISAILETPEKVQHEFNRIVSSYKHIIKGRMGIPFQEEDISVISITVIGTLDEINSFTGKLGNLNNCIVKTSISKKEIEA
ncbi:MAG TPA: iron-only hydrogenase system regulator [Tissierellia bacterium]|nr:iron-only hydrogenase system regulator [Tissierellia bacterium]